MRYRFVRYWFRFVSRPWLDTDIPSKHFVYLQDVFKTCLQDVFSVTIFRLPRRLQDVLREVLKTSSRRLQDVLEDVKLLRWRRVEDVFKTCLEDVLKTNKCLLGRFASLMCIFPLNYQNAYDHQTFQGGDMLQGYLTHAYAWHLNGVALWGHVTNKTHISTCRRCIDTTLGKVLT